MKNLLKILTLIILTSIVALNCSNESTDANNDNIEIDNTGDNGDTANGATQLISHMQLLNAPDWDIGAQFFYENDKLQYVYLSNCSGQTHAFEYNNQGKISKRYEGNVDFFDPNTFDLVSFKEESPFVLNYIYDGSKLTDMKSEDEFIYYHFSYNTTGRLQAVEEFLPFLDYVGKLWAKITISYNNDIVSALNLKEYSTTGALNRNYNYTFEYDSNSNPMYTLSIAYNLVNLNTCQGINYIASMDGGYSLFENNVTKIYRDGEIYFTATYEYNENGYPTRMSYTNYFSNLGAVELFSYLEQ